jgi:hypothetical protein
MTNPLSIIETGNTLGVEKSGKLRLLFWSELICRFVNLPPYNFVQ